MRRYWILPCVTFLTLGLVVQAADAKKKEKKAKPPAPEPRTVVVQGTVFEDLNEDGRRDEGEPALGGMPVSDGIELFKTDETGQFKFEIHEKIGGTVFVCTPAGWRASKKFFAVADFDNFAGKTQTADISLVRDAHRNAETFNFVQMTDIHVVRGDSVETCREDIEVINRLTDVPTFVIATGDLVNQGKEAEQLESYMAGTADCHFPIYNVVGNHDYGGKIRSTENYEKIVGPRYYSFDVGRYHFIARDSIASARDKAAEERQKKWIAKDIELNARDKRIIFFQHFIPTTPQLDKWSEWNTVGVFSGHWHGRRELVYKGILDVNSAPLRFGGIDRSPRGFRIIHVEGDKLRCEWRVGQQNRHVEVIYPANETEVGGKTIPLRVLAYDTAVRVNRISYEIHDLVAGESPQNKPLASGAMTRETAWNWSATWEPGPSVKPGPKIVSIRVKADDGSEWQAVNIFTLGQNASAQPNMGEDWPFFHNDAGHRGYVTTGPQPPLSLAWATAIPGTIHLGSPVIADGRVYIGSHFRESLDDCGVVALNLADGKPLWRSSVDSSIKHSLGVWKDNVLAVSQAGTLYCFDRDGKPRWDASLARHQTDRWELSFPVTDGKTVYAGRNDGFGAFDLATGTRLWKRDSGRDWWPNVYSGPSIGQGVVYQGGPLVRALNPADGEVLWSHKKMAVSTVAVVPAVVEKNEKGDRLYVFHNRKTLKCLDGKTGDILWEAKFGPGAGKEGEVVPLGDETGTPAVGEDIVCIGGAYVEWPGTKGGRSVMHGFDKQTGTLRWHFEIDPDSVALIPYQRHVPTITGSPIIVGNVVYFGASNGYLYALDAKTGKLAWKFRFGVPLASTLAVTGNTIIVAAWDGTIYALTSGS